MKAAYELGKRDGNKEAVEYILNAIAQENKMPLKEFLIKMDLI